MANTNLGQLRVNDPVITQIVHGYVQADSIAPFIAPIVPVPVRSGNVIRFGKEQFAVVDTRRAPGSAINRVNTSYTADPFFLTQHAVGGEVTEEAYQEALNGEARVDLRQNAALRAAETIAQSWESQVISTVTNAAAFETSCKVTLSGTAKFNNSASDPEITVQNAKEAVRAQVGVYPNRAVIDSGTYNALKFHPLFRDRIKYTSSASINLAMLATWFDLPGGIRVAQRVKLDPVTQLLSDIMPAGTMLLFYSPEAEMPLNHGSGTIFTPVNGADRAKPAFAYTYQLDGYPIAAPERFDEDRRVYITDVIAEQNIQLVGLGATGLVGAGYLISGTL